MAYNNGMNVLDPITRDRLRRGNPRLLEQLEAEGPSPRLMQPIAPKGFGPGGTYAIPEIPIPQELATANSGAVPSGPANAFNVRQSYVPYMQAEPPLPGPQRVGGGLKQRLLGALMGLGLAGPAGLIAGAIDPNISERLRYQQIEEPRLLQQRALRGKEREGQLEAARQAAAVSGYDPITGLPTLAREGLEERTAQAEARAAQAQANALSIQQRFEQGLALRQMLGEKGLDIRQEGNEIRREGMQNQISGQAASAIMNLYKTGQGSLTPEARTALIKAGVPESFVGRLPETFDPSRVFAFTDEQGNVTGVAINPITKQQTPTGTTPGVGRPSGKQEPLNDIELDKTARNNVSEKWRISGRVTGKQDPIAKALGLGGSDNSPEAFEREVADEVKRLKGINIPARTSTKSKTPPSKFVDSQGLFGPRR